MLLGAVTAPDASADVPIGCMEDLHRHDVDRKGRVGQKAAPGIRLLLAQTVSASQSIYRENDRDRDHHHTQPTQAHRHHPETRTFAAPDCDGGTIREIRRRVGVLRRLIGIEGLVSET